MRSLLNILVLGLCLAAAGAAPAMAGPPTVAELLAKSETLSLAGKLEEAQAAAQQALALARANGDADGTGDALDAACHASITLTGFGAADVCQEAYDQRLATLGKDHFKTYAAMAALANIYLENDQERAVAMTREAAENMERLAATPDEKWQAGAAWSMLALAHKFRGAYVEALPAYERAITIMSAPDAAPNISLAATLTDYADTLIVVGDYERARDYAQRGVALREKMQDAGHPDIADSLGVLGDALRRMGRYDEAEAYFRRSIDIAENSTPQIPQILGRQYQNLGMVYMFTGRWDEAHSLQRRAISVLETMGDNGVQALSSVYYDTARVHMYKGDLRAAIASGERALEVSLRKYDRKFDRSLSIITFLALLRFRAGDYDQARALIDEVLETRLANAPGSASTADALMLRATMLISREDYAAARTDLEMAYAIIEPLNPNATVAISVRHLLARTMIGQAVEGEADAAYDLAVKAAHAQAYVLSNMTRTQSATGGLQTSADRREVFDTVLDAAWRKSHAGS